MNQARDADVDANPDVDVAQCDVLVFSQRYRRARNFGHDNLIGSQRCIRNCCNRERAVVAGAARNNDLITHDKVGRCKAA